jgi:hypothetical protein
MSRKTKFEEPFEAPSPEEILNVVNYLGGKPTAAKICRKNWNTIDRWCKGSVKIDYANWKLISESNAS